MMSPEIRDGWCPHIEVRSVGPGTFEARTAHGYYSAVGSSVKESVRLLRDKLPAHRDPTVEVIPLPAPRRLDDILR